MQGKPEVSGDLAQLVLLLRAAGFRVDTRQYLAANELLLRSAALGLRLEEDPSEFVHRLGPIFCTSPSEQCRFSEVVELWRGAPPAAPGPPPILPAPDTGARRRWLGLLLLGAALLLVAVAAVWWRHQWRRIDLPGVVTDASPARTARLANVKLTLNGAHVRVAEDGTFVVSMARGEGVKTLEASLDGFDANPRAVSADVETPVMVQLVPTPRAPPPKDPAATIRVGAPLTLEFATGPKFQERRTPRRSWAILLGIALGSSLFVLWFGIDRWRRRLVLRALPSEKRPSFLSLGTAEDVDTPLADVRRVAAALRRSRVGSGEEFDPSATLDATLRSAGLMRLVYRRRRARPEYVALVEQVGLADHRAILTHRLLDPLEARDVPIQRYDFRGDPRTCFEARSGRARALEEIAAEHDRATCLIFVDPAQFFTLEGVLERWVQTLQLFPRRACFSPVPPYRWGREAWNLSDEGFVVLPANEIGLAAYAELESDHQWRIADLFPARYARPFPPSISASPSRWVQRKAPLPGAAERLFRELDAYLGPEGFDWLAACAVFPVIRWDLTVELGLSISGTEPPHRHDLLERLPSLARLPWFRTGSMPEWLRRALMVQLDPAQQKRVRRALESRLGRMLERGATSSAAKDEREAGGHLPFTGWIEPLDIIRTAASDSPMRDALFVSYMSGGSIDSKVFPAPSLSRQLLRLRSGDDRAAVFPRSRRTLGQTLAGAWSAFREKRRWVLPAFLAACAALLPVPFFVRAFTRVEPVESRPEITALAYSPEGDLLAAGLSNGTCGIWAAGATDAGVRLLVGHSGTIESVAFSPDGGVLVTASEDRSAILWDARTGNRLASFSHPAGVTFASFSPDGTEVLTASTDGLARRWNARSGDAVGRPLAHGKPIDVVAMAEHGNVLTSGRGAGTIVWDGRSGAKLREFKGEPRKVQPTSRFLARNRILLTEKVALLSSAPRDPRAQSRTQATPSLNQAQTVVLSFDSNPPVNVLTVPQEVASLDSSGERVALVDSERVVIYELDGGVRVVSIHDARVRIAIPSSSDVGLVTVSGSGTIGLWGNSADAGPAEIPPEPLSDSNPVAPVLLESGRAVAVPVRDRIRVYPLEILAQKPTPDSGTSSRANGSGTTDESGLSGSGSRTPTQRPTPGLIGEGGCVGSRDYTRCNPNGVCFRGACMPERVLEVEDDGGGPSRATWRWEKVHYQANWDNGESAAVNVVRWVHKDVRLERRNADGSLAALYTGTLSPEGASGGVTWIASDRKGRQGRWATSFSGSAPSLDLPRGVSNAAPNAAVRQDAVQQQGRPPPLPFDREKLLADLSGRRRSALELALDLYERRVPFKVGGKQPSEGLDTSGFVTYILGQVGVLPEKLEMTSAALRDRFRTKVVVSLDAMSPGDLLFEANNACWFLLRPGSKEPPLAIGMIPTGITIADPRTVSSRIETGLVPYEGSRATAK